MSRVIDRSGGAVCPALLGALVCIATIAASDARAQSPTLDQLARDNVAQKMRMHSGGGLIAPAAGPAVNPTRVQAEPASGIGPQRLLAVYGVESSLAAEIDFGSSIARMSNERPGPIAGWTLATVTPTHVVLVRRTGRGDERRLLVIGSNGREPSAGSSVSKSAAAAAVGSDRTLSPLSPRALLPIATGALTR